MLVTALGVLALGAALLATTGGGEGGTGGGAAGATLPSLASPLLAAPTVAGAAPVEGFLRAPGGPFLRDRAGRVVFLHGVNVVNKRAPFEVYPDPGKPWNFDAHDASLMARLGVNLVRLGMLWRGLEPGTAPANDPAICSSGPPGDPHQFSQAIFDRYVGRLRRTVDLLARYHIFTMLDMHQDVYNQMFDGEGAPNWAVCTDGVPSVDPPGRWSRTYGTKAAGIAYDHFWDNNVVGNLQGQYDMVWGKVAHAFADDPWVIGYDTFNEPFSASLVRSGDEHFDAQLECFYTGRAHVGTALHGAPPITCPPGVPEDGVIPTILANDPHHLVFDEPDNYASRGYPTFLGPMAFPNLVFNFHVYCGARSPKTGNPTDVAKCGAQERRTLKRRSEDRPEMASRHQPGGPAWIMSEFGATSDPALLGEITAEADRRLVGWAYWSWRYYADPTGSAAEGLVMADGKVRSTASVLARIYPEAVAGTPTSFSYDPARRTFHLVFRSAAGVRAPTVLVVPSATAAPGGSCVKVQGARVTSRAASALVTVVARGASHRVSVSVGPGPCPS